VLQRTTGAPWRLRGRGGSRPREHNARYFVTCSFRQFLRPSAQVSDALAVPGVPARSGAVAPRAPPAVAPSEHLSANIGRCQLARAVILSSFSHSILSSPARRWVLDFNESDRSGLTWRTGGTPPFNMPNSSARAPRATKSVLGFANSRLCRFEFFSPRRRAANPIRDPSVWAPLLRRLNRKCGCAAHSRRSALGGCSSSRARLEPSDSKRLPLRPWPDHPLALQARRPGRLLRAGFGLLLEQIMSGVPVTRRARLPKEFSSHARFARQ